MFVLISEGFLDPLTTRINFEDRFLSKGLKKVFFMIIEELCSNSLGSCCSSAPSSGTATEDALLY